MPAFDAKARWGKKIKFASGERLSSKATDRERQEAKARAERLEQHINYKPHERYPKFPLPVSPAPTLREIEAIKLFKENRKQIRHGPLFVRGVADTNARVHKSGAPVHALDGFNALKTYTTKYDRKYRQRPDLSGKTWLKEFLPKELWDVVDASLRKKTKLAAAKPAIAKTKFNINDYSDNEEVEEVEKTDNSGSEDEESESGLEKNVEVPEIDEDWEADEEDDEMNDYNAEQHFDNGEDEDEADDGEYGDDYGGGPNVEEREFAPNEEFEVEG